MKKSTINGRPYWICEKCSFGAETETTAKEHEAQPI